MPTETLVAPARRRRSMAVRWLRVVADSMRVSHAAMGRRRRLRVDLDTMPDWLRRDLGFDDPQRRKRILRNGDGPEGEAADADEPSGSCSPFRGWEAMVWKVEKCRVTSTGE